MISRGAEADATTIGDRRAFYRAVLERLNAAGPDYLVGGAFAMAGVTGIAARTKDLDLFVRKGDVTKTLDLLRQAVFAAELAFPHWLAKVRCGTEVIDIIFNSGNGESPVDDSWFLHALPAEIDGVTVKLCAVEEMIWTKAFVMERERYDGADVAHLLRSGGERLDWPRLLHRFGNHWPVLLSHLVLFSYIYPGEAHRVPSAVLAELIACFTQTIGEPAANSKLCRGGLLSRAQYAVDVLDWGYADARLPPEGHMSAEELRVWNDAAPEPQRLNGGAAARAGATDRRKHG